ncbi:MAG: hypothetical protein P8Q45_02660 [Candidatus Thalassarchaeaceae archaeon]|jgi:hypothetical protein|nr:hypothetical protein [Candidatus Thalassarchaeaceae archaeon]
MPIARYWCVSTGGNELTGEMVQTWKDNFLAYALDNGCIRGALSADADTIVAVSIWPDMATMNAVLDSDAYKQLAVPIIASWGAGGVNLPDDICLVVNSELMALAGEGVDF